MIVWIGLKQRPFFGPSLRGFGHKFRARSETSGAGFRELGVEKGQKITFDMWHLRDLCGTLTETKSLCEVRISLRLAVQRQERL